MSYMPPFFIFAFWSVTAGSTAAVLSADIKYLNHLAHFQWSVCNKEAEKNKLNFRHHHHSLAHSCCLNT